MARPNTYKKYIRRQLNKAHRRDGRTAVRKDAEPRIVNPPPSRLACQLSKRAPRDSRGARCISAYVVRAELSRRAGESGRQCPSHRNCRT